MHQILEKKKANIVKQEINEKERILKELQMAIYKAQVELGGFNWHYLKMIDDLKKKV